MDQLMNSLLVWKNGKQMSAAQAKLVDEQERPKNAQELLLHQLMEMPATPAARVDASQAAIPAKDPRPRSGNTSPSSQEIQQYPKQPSKTPESRVAGTFTAELPKRGAGGCPHPLPPPQVGERILLKPRGPSHALRISSSNTAQRTKANIDLCDSVTPSRKGKMIDDEEIEFETTPAPAPVHTLGLYSDGPLDLMSVDDFEKSIPPPPAPPEKKLPRRTAPPIRLNSKGQHTGAFAQACQARGIAFDFSCFPMAEGCFDVVLKLNGKVVDRIGQYASHKDAKEAICQKHLQTVEAMPIRKKRKSLDAATTALPGVEDEQWVTLLLNYFKQNKLPDPEFTQTAVHLTLGPFLCTVRFSNSPATQFGSNVGPCTTKQAAKKAAAMEAVLWLRAQGLMTETSAKRRKSSSSSNSPGEAGLTRTSKDSTDVDMTDENLSVGEQVHRGVHQLGFSQPRFEHTLLEGSFYDTCVRFGPADVRKEPRLDGEVAKVFHVFGKKAAQQECGRALLGVLDEIKQSRLAG